MVTLLNKKVAKILVAKIHELLVYDVFNLKKINN